MYVAAMGEAVEVHAVTLVEAEQGLFLCIYIYILIYLYVYTYILCRCIYMFKYTWLPWVRP